MCGLPVSTFWRPPGPRSITRCWFAGQPAWLVIASAEAAALIPATSVAAPATAHARRGFDDRCGGFGRAFITAPDGLDTSSPSTVVPLPRARRAELAHPASAATAPARAGPR